MSNIQRYFFALLIAFMHVFTGCQSRNETNTGKKILRMSMYRDASTMDPRKGGDVISATLHFLLYEGLLQREEDPNFSLAVADAFTLSEDKTTYTFHLRSTAWSDGTPVTAIQFEKAWKSCLDPNFPCPNAQLFYPIKNAEAAKKGALSLDEVGIKALDDTTLEISLATPLPYFLTIISFSTFVPFVPAEKPLYNGPFILKSWQHNRELILAKNPHYWNKDAIDLDEIHIYIIDNEMTALHLFENGNLDLIASPLSSMPVDSLSELRKQGKLTTLPEAGSTLNFFNTQAFPFNNVHIRKAFAYAINREEIVCNITQLGETIATSLIPPLLKGENSIFFEDNDGETARFFLQKGLQELGLSSSEELGHITYKYLSTEGNRKIAQILQQQWFRTLGIQVKLEQLEHKFLMETLSRRSYTIAQGFWMAQYPDPMNLLERFNSKSNIKNYSDWENEEFKHLLLLSSQVNSLQERFLLLEKAERLLLEEMVVCPLFHWKSARLAKPHLDIPHHPSCSSAFYRHLKLK